MPFAPTPSDSSRGPLPSPEVRGAVSLFLFIHLFAVAVALGSYVDPSTLEERVRTLLGFYLTTFDFDLNPNAYPSGRFFATHAMPTDVDATIHIDATLADGTERSLTIPEPGLWPPERRRHQQALANAASSLVAEDRDDRYEAVLPRSIAGSVLRSWGATTGRVRIERHNLPTMDDLASSDPARANPFSARYYTTAYEAKVLVSPDGQVDVAKKVAAGEVAPPDKRNQTNPPGQPAGAPASSNGEGK